MTIDLPVVVLFVFLIFLQVATAILVATAIVFFGWSFDRGFFGLAWSSALLFFSATVLLRASLEIGRIIDAKLGL